MSAAKKKNGKSTPAPAPPPSTALAPAPAPFNLRQALEVAISAKLAELVKRPISVPMLLELQKTADNARRIMNTLQLDEASITPGSGVTYNPDGPISGALSSITNPFALPELGGSGTLAPSSAQENFGTKAMRELISIISKANAPKPPSTLELLNSLTMAKEHGLHKLAAKIKKQLNEQTEILSSSEGHESPMQKLIGAVPAMGAAVGMSTVAVVPGTVTAIQTIEE